MKKVSEGPNRELTTEFLRLESRFLFTHRFCRVARGNEKGHVESLLGVGVTLHECLRAANELAAVGVLARVIDLYSVKPLDRDTLVAACHVTGSRLVIVEDHYREGGIGGAVLEALADAGIPALRVAHLAVSSLPGSGTSVELLDAVGISARHIVAAALRLGEQ